MTSLSTAMSFDGMQTGNLNMFSEAATLSRFQATALRGTSASGDALASSLDTSIERMESFFSANSTESFVTIETEEAAETAVVEVVAAVEGFSLAAAVAPIIVFSIGLGIGIGIGELFNSKQTLHDCNDGVTWIPNACIKQSDTGKLKCGYTSITDGNEISVIVDTDENGNVNVCNKSIPVSTLYKNSTITARFKKTGSKILVSNTSPLPTYIKTDSAEFATEVSSGIFQCPNTYTDGKHSLTANFTGASIQNDILDPTNPNTVAYCHYNYQDSSQVIIDYVQARPSSKDYEVCGLNPVPRNDNPKLTGQWTINKNCTSKDPADCGFTYVPFKTCDPGQCPGGKPSTCLAYVDCPGLDCPGTFVPGTCHSPFSGPDDPPAYDVCFADNFYPKCSELPGMKPPLNYCNALNNGGHRACAAPLNNPNPWVCGIDTNLPSTDQQINYCRGLKNGNGMTLCDTGNDGFMYALKKHSPSTQGTPSL